jgi:hypothetical protein
MKNPRLSLLQRIIIRLIATPQCFSMAEFSALSGSCGTTFCIAGLILDECGVVMEYSPEGVAVGLEEGEEPPAKRWVEYEISLSAAPVKPHSVMIAAKARELWAADYGDESAMLLPFYGPEWGLDNADVGQVTAVQVVELLQVINHLATHQSVTP